MFVFHTDVSSHSVFNFQLRIHACQILVKMVQHVTQTMINMCASVALVTAVLTVKLVSHDIVLIVTNSTVEIYST